MHVQVVELKFWPGKSVGENVLRTQQRMRSGSACDIQWVYAAASVTQENYNVVQTNCYCVCFQNPRCYSTQWSLSVLELQFTSTFLPYLQNVNLWLACFSTCRLCILCEFIAMNFLAFARLSARCYISTSLQTTFNWKRLRDLFVAAKSSLGSILYQNGWHLHRNWKWFLRLSIYRLFE